LLSLLPRLQCGHVLRSRWTFAASTRRAPLPRMMWWWTACVPAVKRTHRCPLITSMCWMSTGPRRLPWAFLQPATPSPRMWPMVTGSAAFPGSSSLACLHGCCLRVPVTQKQGWPPPPTSLSGYCQRCPPPNRALSSHAIPTPLCCPLCPCPCQALSSGTLSRCLS
jgi:hypothetical protein